MLHTEVFFIEGGKTLRGHVEGYDFLEGLTIVIIKMKGAHAKLVKIPSSLPYMFGPNQLTDDIVFCRYSGGADMGYDDMCPSDKTQICHQFISKCMGRNGCGADYD
ncbi:hypothetical protein GY45DRAFT_1338195 [Cubamyces sp. BRFM 1775]|nr:hypothetical protein GY45DRAFT_1338195 [Cubamyces sp. BRFM 1775]